MRNSTTPQRERTSETQPLRANPDRNQALQPTRIRTPEWAALCLVRMSKGSEVLLLSSIASDAMRKPVQNTLIKETYPKHLAKDLVAEKKPMYVNLQKAYLHREPLWKDIHLITCGKQPLPRSTFAGCNHLHSVYVHSVCCMLESHILHTAYLHRAHIH